MTDETNNKPIEIVLGNKNVAEAGSTQVNITQNNITPDAVLKLTELMGLKSPDVCNASASSPANVSSNTSKPKSRQTKKKPRDVQEVFRYKWLNQRDAQKRLIYLYKLLIHKNYGWLDDKVTPDDWYALFMGVPKTFKIKWKKSQAYLKRMFDLMIERGYIEVSGSAGKWEILGSHFVSTEGRPFKTEWNKVAEPKRGADVIEKVVEILNISKTLDDVDIEELDYEKPKLEDFFEEESCIIPKVHKFKRDEDC